MTKRALLMLLILPACSKHEPEASPVAAEPKEKLIAVDPALIASGRITVGHAEKKAPGGVIVASGQIEPPPDGAAAVGSPITARVKSIAVRRGDSVKKGAELAVLEAGEVARVRADLARAKARRVHGERVLAQEEKLAKENATSERALSDARSEVGTARADELAASSLLRSFGAGGGALLRLRAPIDGTVVAVDGVVGAPVEATQALVRLVDTSRLVVRADVAENDADLVPAGAKATLSVGGKPLACTAKVESHAPDVDRATRTVPFRIRLGEGCGDFHSGAFVDVAIERAVDGAKPLVALPRDAVVSVDEVPLVFVEKAPAKFEPVSVRVAEWAGPLVFLEDGLQGGEPVAQRGALLLKGELMRSRLSEPMIGRLARLVVEFPLLTILGVVALVIVGVESYRKLPIDAVPDLTNVQVQVLTSAPGLSPTEVERLVTQPVELAMTGVPHVARIRSVSRSGVSAVTLVFDDDTELAAARELVAQRLPAAREVIPPSAGRPELGPLTTSLGEVYHFTVRWPGHSLREIRTLLDWDIAYRLRSVPGVVEVNSWGGDTRQIEVRLRERDLIANGVTAREVEEAVLGSGQNVSAGFVERSEEGTFVRAEASYRTREDVARQVVSTRRQNGTVRPLLVQDVADVVDGSAPRFAAATADGRGETVYTMVQMIAGGNAHEVVARVKDRLGEVQKSLPAGVVVEPFYDRSAFVDEVLGTVKKNLLEGGAIVAMVLLIMLGHLRAGLVVASVIPLSMLGAFALMRYFGVSGNLLSLGAIDFGLVVDGSVVVIEGALAAMATHHLTGKQAMGRVAGEMGRAVTMAVVIIAIVYVPVLLLQGVEGKMFRPMALTVLFALGVALVLTFTWVPAIGGLLLTGAHHGDPRIVVWLKRGYRPVVTALVDRWKLAAAGALVLIVAGVAIAATRGAEFVPRLEEGDLAIQVTRPPSVSLAEATRGTTVVEQVVKRFPEVERVVSRTGSPDVATDVMGPEQSDVLVILKPRKQWVTARDAAGFAEVLSPELEKALPGAAFGFTQPIEMRVDELIGGVKADVGVKIFGDDLTTLRKTAEQLSQVISGTRGAADVRVEPMSGLGMLTLTPDTREMGRRGVKAVELASFIETMRSGRHAGHLIEGERRFDVMLRSATVPAADDGPIQRVRVPLEEGRSVLLGDVARVSTSDGPAQVSREQGRRRVLIEVNVRGRDLASFVQDLRARIDKVKLPPGYWVEYGGEYENLASATARLAIVVPLTLAAVLVLLYLAFGSIRPALLIFVNVPAAATGGFLALGLRGLELSVSAAVGFLALFGVATLNGVVLLASVRNRQLQGEETRAAVLAAADERVRPVLVTALVAALGFVPMAIATGTGAEVQRPLATVVIGGLVTASLVTLLALPALYVRFGGKPEAADGAEV